MKVLRRFFRKMIIIIKLPFSIISELLVLRDCIRKSRACGKHKNVERFYRAINKLLNFYLKLAKKKVMRRLQPVKKWGRKISKGFQDFLENGGGEAYINALNDDKKGIF